MMNLELIQSEWPVHTPGSIQLYALNTPNGIKVSVALEELALRYDAHLIDIGTNIQKSDAFLAINPNGKIPAIIDLDGPARRGSGAPQPHAIFESGAILVYLAEKAGALLPTNAVERSECLQWLFFQVGGVGPMFGQFGHFLRYAGAKCDHPYPLARYTDETRRLLEVLEHQLQDREYLAADTYTIADIATWPWVRALSASYSANTLLELERFTAVSAWLERCVSRPASQRGIHVCAK